MIFEWALSTLLTFFFPASLSSFNPFYLPIAGHLLRRKPFVAAMLAYILGIMRDIFLATPRFGLLGMASLFSALVATSFSFYFSLEGFLGTLALTTILTCSDVLFTASLGSFFCGQFFFSWRAFFVALLFSTLWTISVKSVPLALRFFSLRRRHRDEDS